jgi:hypothetical protein
MRKRCDSCALTKGTGMTSFIYLFASEQSLAAMAKPAWVWGALWSLIMVALALVFVGVGKGKLKVA